MGIIVKPELDDYWSMDPLLHTPLFGETMSRDRWLSIMQFLHFSDNTQANPEDKLCKVRPLLDLLLDRFRNVYIPDKVVSVDEELIAWRGRLQFRQFIPSKRARFGIKIFALCETSGYMFNFIVYVGKDHTSFDQQLVAELGKSGAVAATLMQPLLDQGYHLYVDNWYMSVVLAEYFLQRGTMICGTLRKDRKGIPKTFANYARLKKGEYIFRSANGMLLVKLLDTKAVHFLSTIHRASLLAANKRDRFGRRVKKLAVVHDYNRSMGGVDRNDEMLSFYTAARKTTKWYKKIATHVVEEGLLNAFLCYKKSGGQKRHCEFLKAAIKGMLGDGGGVGGQALAKRQRHYPSLVAPTEKKEKPQKRCVLCSKQGQRKESRYQCLSCPGAPGLCAAPCFAAYHGAA